MLTKICAGTYSDGWRCQHRLQKLAAEGIKTFEYFYSQNWRKDFLFLLPKIVFDFLATHQCWDEMCKEPSTTGSEMETTLAGSWLFSGSNWFYYYFIIKGSGLVNLPCLSHLFWQIQMQKNMQKSVSSTSDQGASSTSQTTAAASTKSTWADGDFVNF